MASTVFLYSKLFYFFATLSSVLYVLTWDYSRQPAKCPPSFIYYILTHQLPRRRVFKAVMLMIKPCSRVNNLNPATYLELKHGFWNGPKQAIQKGRSVYIHWNLINSGHYSFMQSTMGHLIISQWLRSLGIWMYNSYRFSFHKSLMSV